MEDVSDRLHRCSVVTSDGQRYLARATAKPKGKEGVVIECRLVEPATRDLLVVAFAASNGHGGWDALVHLGADDVVRIRKGATGGQPLSASRR